jgi:uncharacterized protein (DUF2141 family)
MAEERVIKIVVDSGQAKKSTKELTDEISEQKKILIELEKELHKVDVALKNTSKGNLSAQKSLRDQSTHLKDSIKDQKIALKELGLEKSNSIKIDKETNLSYVESSKLVALLDNVTGGYASKIVKLYKGFDAGVKSVKGFNNGLSSMKKALISTGIGALVVALGIVVAYWDEINEFINGGNKKLETQQGKINEQIEAQTVQLDLLKQQLSIEELKNGESPKLTAEYRKQLVIQIEQNVALLENLQTQLELEESKNKEVTLWEKTKILASGLISPSLKAAEIGKAVNKNSERSIELTNKINEAKKKTGAIDLEIAQLDNKETKKKEDAAKKAKAKKDKELEDEFNHQEKINSIREKFRLQNEDAEDITEFEKLNRKYERDLLDLERLGASEQQKLELETYYARLRNEQLLAIENELFDAEEQIEIEKENKRLEDAEKQIRLEQSLADAKKAIGMQSLTLLAELAGRGSKIAKGVAIAQAVISTYQGINKALAETTDFTPTQSLRFANAALVGVAGFANIANILKTNEMGQGGFGASANNAQPQTSAPSFNLVQGTGSNQVAETINQNQRPIQAFVVGSNVTSQQELDRRRVANSTL